MTSATSIRSAAILGAGVVGHAMAQAIALRDPSIALRLVDPTPRCIRCRHIPPGALVGDLREIPAFAPDVYFVCTGTPGMPGGHCDIASVSSACASIADHIDRTRRGAIVAIRSTVPPGSADGISDQMARRTSVPFRVLSNPEFLRQRHALSDTLYPSRVVIGGHHESSDTLARFYEHQLGVDAQRIQLVISARTAEAIKYVSNAMLAGRVALFNELADWAARAGADVGALQVGVGADSRIGPIHASAGYSGACLPKDVDAILADDPWRLPILRAVQDANTLRRQRSAIS